jgi:hypothetical protein
LHQMLQRLQHGILFDSFLPEIKIKFGFAITFSSGGNSLTNTLE